MSRGSNSLNSASELINRQSLPLNWFVALFQGDDYNTGEESSKLCLCSKPDTQCQVRAKSRFGTFFPCNNTLDFNHHANTRRLKGYLSHQINGTKTRSTELNQSTLQGKVLNLHPHRVYAYPHRFLYQSFSHIWSTF